MKVAVVTSIGACGISEHSVMLATYVRKADPDIELIADSRWLDPTVLIQQRAERKFYDVLHLNYHRGLHSRWTPELLKDSQEPIVVTFHDTYEVQPDQLAFELLAVCDRMIVHEPCDLSTIGASIVDDRQLEHLDHAEKVRYWRQGVLEPEVDAVRDLLSDVLGTPSVQERPAIMDTRPYVGTFGFNFPWKGFDLLCEAATHAGWGVVILSNNADEEAIKRWKALNPWTLVRTGFLSSAEIVNILMRCDATAFLYQCANSGTSGAIRLGIAAGKPVLATRGCRQFRDLQDAAAEYVSENRTTTKHTLGIRWVHPNVESLTETLSQLTCAGTRFDPRIVWLREHDSWRHLGAKYAALYRELVP